jgi:hypothetical protein
MGQIARSAVRCDRRALRSKGISGVQTQSTETKRRDKAQEKRTNPSRVGSNTWSNTYGERAAQLKLSITILAADNTKSSEWVSTQNTIENSLSFPDLSNNLSKKYC